MTFYEPDQWERGELLLTCPRCDAPRGEWCVTRNGGHPTALHAARRELAVAIRQPAIDHWADIVRDLRAQLRELRAAELRAAQ